MPVTAEAVVIGGGVMGCSILHALGRRGLANALLLERDVLASGSTGRSQGILRMHYSNEVTTRLAWESLRTFKFFDEMVGGPSAYAKAGYLLIVGPNERQALVENVDAQQALGVRTDVLTAAQAQDVAPAVAVAEEESCAYESESGYADPYLVTHGYAAAARRLGATIRTSTPATGIQVKDGRVARVTYPDGEVSTPIAVVAVGPWSKELSRPLGVELPLETVRHQVVMLRRPRQHVFTHPVIGDVPNGFSARPDLGDVTLVATGETEHAAPDDYNQGVNMSAVAQVTAGLVSRMPGMRDSIFRGGWSGLFTTTPDWHPIIDAVPGIEGLYVAAGFSGHGFKLAPMVGVTMAEMVVDGAASSVDVTGLRLGRFEDGALLGSRYGMRVLA